MTNLDKKYRKLLTKVKDLTEDEYIYDLLDQLLEEKTFLKFVQNTYDWTPEEHDGLLLLLTPPRNENGYYTDKYGNKISYNGIRVLKREKTELDLNTLHKIEIEKCKKSFKYFRSNYCFITTKTGLARPEPRRYQVFLEDELLSLEDLVVLYPRQSGKCNDFSTIINIKNKHTGELVKMPIGEFHEMINEQSKQKTSLFAKLYKSFKNTIYRLFRS